MTTWKNADKYAYTSRIRTRDHIIRTAQEWSRYTQNPFIYDVVEWLAFLLLIREIPGSNLGPEAGCSEVFMGFLSVST
jgi:hypothetical protein